MRRVIFFIVLLFTAPLLFGQNKPIQQDELLFEKGYLLQQLLSEELELQDIINSTQSVKDKQELAIQINETILEKAVEYYQELVDSFPGSKLLFRALNNKGLIELSLGDKKNAVETFQFILNSKANDREKGGSGSGLMAEPYANYKNRAAKIMANICIKDSNYADAIKYLDLTKQYPYRHFCGNEIAAERNELCQSYAQCYLGLKDKKKAFALLLPNILDNRFADNTDLVELTYNALLLDYTKDDLKFKYEQAFKNYRIEKVKSKDETYEQYFITFLDEKIVLSSVDLHYAKKEKKQNEVYNIYKDSKFYALLNR